MKRNDSGYEVVPVLKWKTGFDDVKDLSSDEFSDKKFVISDGAVIKYWGRWMGQGRGHLYCANPELSLDTQILADVLCRQHER